MDDNVSISTVSSYIFNGLLITPKDLLFQNAYEGKSFREKIVLQNVSSKPVRIKTIFPVSYSFILEKKLHDVKLSCGLSEVLWVQYTYTHSSPMRAMLDIYVNGQKTNVNFEVLLSRSIVNCEPRILDFNIINMGYAVNAKKITLKNEGRKLAKFEFDIPPNSLGLAIIPQRGFIEGKTSKEIEVELIGFEEGFFRKDIWIKCEEPIRFTIIVEVIKPRLFISSLHEYTENFLPIMFPPVYGGCRAVQSFEIFSFNMLETRYIIVPEMNFRSMIHHKVIEVNPDFKRFRFIPEEEVLTPCQTKTCLISFETEMTKCQFDKVTFVCYRLIKLECQTVEQILGEQRVKIRKSTMTKSEGVCDAEENVVRGRIFDRASENLSLSEDDKHQRQSFEDFVRLCIYGVVISVKVVAEPENFCLDEMPIDTQTERDLTLRNNSKSLPIYFEYVKAGYVNIRPSKGYIEILDSINLKVTFSAKTAGAIEKPIHFRLLYHSQVQDVGKPVLTDVGTLIVPVSIPVKIPTKQLNITFNTGITPRITNEIGFMTNDVQFSTNVTKPRQAVLQCYQLKPNMKYDDAKIAFPNDRPLVLRPARDPQ